MLCDTTVHKYSHHFFDFVFLKSLFLCPLTARFCSRMPLACVLLGWMCAAPAAEDWSVVDNGWPETGRRLVISDGLLTLPCLSLFYDVLC